MAEATMPRTVVVASVPSDHVYVRHIGPAAPSDKTVRRLPDPHPEVPGRVADGRWWPPRMLHPDWVRAQPGGAFDVLHLHFGYDDRTPEDLRDLVAALRSREVPLVLTVHDLRNPHHDHPGRLERQLDVLLPAAAAVVTLTDGAGAVLRAQWGVDALVLPHPHVVPLGEIAGLRAGRRPRRDRRRVGLSAKSLRTNTDPLRLLPGLLGLGAGVEVVVDVHHDVYDDPATPYAARLRGALDDLASAGQITLLVHDPLSDDELWAHLAGLDVAVLPYRFGTHSGWLEACRDVGTRVVAPSAGQYADQGADAVYDADEESVDLGSLADAVRRTLEACAVPAAGPAVDPEGFVAWRRRQRDDLARAHEDLYRDVLARVAAS